MKNNLELKPCPFCGCDEVEEIVRDPDAYGKFLVEKDDLYRCGVRCPSCKVMVVGASAGEVAGKWNRRGGEV